MGCTDSERCENEHSPRLDPLLVRRVVEYFPRRLLSESIFRLFRKAICPPSTPTRTVFDRETFLRIQDTDEDPVEEVPGVPFVIQDPLYPVAEGPTLRSLTIWMIAIILDSIALVLSALTRWIFTNSSSISISNTLSNSNDTF